VEANPGMVKNAVGSASNQDCAPNCFIPSTIAISTGDTVTWVNTDTAAHTATGGTPANGASGVWDSSLMMAGGTSFSHTFDTAGTYPYLCMVHPWMTGTVIVTGAAVEEEIVIPSWIKSNAGWWDAGLIDDRNYVTGLQWLISNGIMTIPSTEQGTGSDDDVIPSWVKNNARWWADGSIDDRNYVTGLQWLITNGVMTIG
jgi:plastocyanin